ncbi:MAG: hypothetical protein RSE32_16310 [Comamonas sp.]|uniref:hypothetical protein n=1 Tax=Comamonas sp. TaxID=34028 RepID=UPI002FCBE229
MHFELMKLEDAADVLTLDTKCIQHEDGTMRYALPCGAKMIEVIPGQTFFKVTL